MAVRTMLNLIPSISIRSNRKNLSKILIRKSKVLKLISRRRRNKLPNREDKAMVDLKKVF